MRYALALMIILSGCQPSFDEKFDETEQQLKADAARIDSEMAAESKQEPGEE